MRILIAYTTKYGASEKCAKLLEEELIGKCDLIDLKKMKSMDIARYDKIILGGSIYAGSSQPELRCFVLDNCEELCKKPLGLYLSCMGFDASSVETYFWETFKGELLDHATAIRSFGGIFDFKKMNFIERFLIKKIRRDEAIKKGVKNLLEVKENINTISKERIKQFAKDMNSLIISEEFNELKYSQSK